MAVRTFFLLSSVATLPLWSQSTLTSVEMRGLQRLPKAAVIEAAGLKLRQPITKAEYDGACNRLLKTGLIEACEYSFINSPAGQAVDFKLKETPASMKASISVPGATEAELWEWLRKNEPLVTPEIPDNDDATQFYVRAVERFLSAKGGSGGVKADIQTDLGTKQTSLRFRPEKLDRITGVTFTGATAVDATVLKQAVERVARDRGFLESDFRELLALNATPLFERQGYLAVRYANVERSPTGEVRVTVEQGPLYRFGRTSTRDLKPGALANWMEVLKAGDRLAQAAREEGYLQARAKIDRKLQPNQTVDVEIAVDRGPLFRFGELRITGLDPSTVARIKPLWKLAGGAPMRESYPATFLKEATDAGLLGTRSFDASIRIEPRPGSQDIVDVVLAFK